SGTLVNEMSLLCCDGRSQYRAHKEERVIYPLGELRPQIHPTVFVAPTATVIGDVVMEMNSSVWFGAILRGDSGQIVIGEGSNIQDGAVIHDGAKIGKNCTISHMAAVH